MKGRSPETWLEEVRDNRPRPHHARNPRATLHVGSKWPENSMLIHSGKQPVMVMQ